VFTHSSNTVCFFLNFQCSKLNINARQQPRQKSVLLKSAFTSKTLLLRIVSLICPSKNRYCNPKTSILGVCQFPTLSMRHYCFRPNTINTFLSSQLASRFHFNPLSVYDAIVRQDPSCPSIEWQRLFKFIISRNGRSSREIFFSKFSFCWIGDLVASCDGSPDLSLEVVAASLSRP
jgi:hypothetical protein